MNYTIRRILLVIMALVAVRPNEVSGLKNFLIILPPNTALMFLGAVLALLITSQRGRMEKNFELLILFYIAIAMLFLVAELIWPGHHMLAQRGMVGGFAPALFVIYIYAVLRLLGGDDRNVIVYLGSYVFFVVLIMLIVSTQDVSQYGTYNPEFKRHNFPFAPIGMNSNTYAFILSVGASACVYLIFNTTIRSIIKWSLAASIPFMFVNSLLMGTRSVLPIYFVMFIYSLAKMKIKLKHVCIVTLCIVPLLAFAFGSLSGLDALSSKEGNEMPWDKVGTTSDVGRRTSMVNSLQEIFGHASLGQGYAGASVAHWELGLHSSEHNQVLLFTNAYGIFFLLPFVLFVWFSIKKAFVTKAYVELLFLIPIVIATITTPFLTFYSMCIWFVMANRKRNLSRVSAKIC